MNLNLRQNIRYDNKKKMDCSLSDYNKLLYRFLLDISQI